MTSNPTDASALNSILLHGGAGDGVTDNSAALLAAWAARPDYPSAYFPPGNYAFAGKVSYPGGLSCAVSLTGAGADTTVLSWPNDGGGLIFNCDNANSCVNASNLTFATRRPDGGNGVTLTQTAPSGGRRPQSNFTNLTFRGVDPSDYWGSAISVENLSVINFTNVLITGNVGMAYANVGNGVQLIGSQIGVVYNFTNCTFDCVGNGIVFDKIVQGVDISGCNFTGCTNGIFGGGPTGDIDQVTVANCQFDCQSAGIATLQNVQIGNLFINNNLFLIANNATGVLLDVDLSTTIIGNTFQYNGQPNVQQKGVIVFNTRGNVGGILIGNRFWGLQTGWILDSTTNNWKIQSNVYSSNSNNYSNLNTSNSVGLPTA